MPSKIRKMHSKAIKFKAVIAMLKGEKTVQEISQEFSVHQSALHKWKKHFIEKGPDVFEDKMSKLSADPSVNLERKIGQLTMEIDFLKKVLGQ
jgi:transposase